MTTITKNKLFLVLGFAALASCKSYDIKPGSERIRVFESEPKGCIFLGEIPAEQEDKVVGKKTEIEMSLLTRVELRNKAHELQANVIVFANRNKKPSSVAVPAAPPAAAGDAKKAAAAGAPAEAPAPPPPVVEKGDDDSERKVTTVFLATVFRCPPNIVNQ
jgi:hypothetical protein